MKILAITNLYPPYAIGGYERLCADVCLRLENRGHELHVLTSTYGSDRRRVDGQIRRLLPLESRFDRIYRSKNGKGAVGTMLDIARTRAITARTIRQVRPDVVYVWNLGYLHRSVLDATRESGVPVAFHLGDPWPKYKDAWCKKWNAPAYHPRRRVPKRIIAKTLRAASLLCDESLRADDLVACSCNALKQELLEAGLTLGRATVINEGIPLDEIGDIDVGRAKGNQTPRSMLFAGQLLEHKGAHTVVEAMTLLRQREACKDLALTILGSGDDDYKARLHDSVESLGLRESVTFREPVPRAELPRVLSEHDIFVFPSIWPEPWSLLLLTGMACGMPVACTATGGSAELAKDGENAVTFDAGSPPSLAQAVERIVTDADLRTSIAKNARNLVWEHYGIETMVDHVEHLLATACAHEHEYEYERRIPAPVAVGAVQE